MHRAFSVGCLTLALLAGCDSKITTTVDPTLQARYETLVDCFPGLYAKAERLLDIAETWRLRGTPVPDPNGLTFAEQSDGSVTVTYVFDGTTVAMTIRFYSPTGVVQNLALGSPGSLHDLIDTAADELQNAFPAGDSFLVGSWTASGAGVSGSGAVTGVLTRDSGVDTLLELSTTSATPAGGPPPAATSTLSDSGPPACTLTFDIPGLQIDTSPLAYPVGNLDLVLVGPEATVNATITFDGTSTATVVVDGIRGSFRFDVVTRSLTFVLP